MDRTLVWPGAVPMETDILSTNKNAMVALGKLAGAIFGTSSYVNGLQVGANSPAALNVIVQPGEIYSLQNIDGTAYSSLAADTAHQIIKQGILLDAVTLSTPAPGTAGQSINYLIQAAFSEVDSNATVLPYYNASNPAQAYSGPSNTGSASFTTRSGTVILTAKAGTAATTGSQVTPAPDSGYVGLAVVTVAYGATTVAAGNISTYAAAPYIGTPITNGRLLNVKTFTANSTYTPTLGTKSIIVEAVGGGGGSGGVPATASGTTGISSAGSSGAYAKAYLTSGFSNVAVTVGAGGTAGTSGGAAGANGGTTSFGALLTCPGGKGTLFGAAASGVQNIGIGGAAAAASGTGIIASSVGALPQNAIQATAGYASNWCSPPSAMPGTDRGKGADGLYNGPSNGAIAGNAGQAGLVVVWEYA